MKFTQSNLCLLKIWNIAKFPHRYLGPKLFAKGPRVRMPSKNPQKYPRLSKFDNHFLAWNSSGKYPECRYKLNLLLSISGPPFPKKVLSEQASEPFCQNWRKVRKGEGCCSISNGTSIRKPDIAGPFSSQLSIGGPFWENGTSYSCSLHSARWLIKKEVTTARVQQTHERNWKWPAPNLGVLPYSLIFIRSTK